MAGPEAKIERDIVKEAEAAGWVVYKLNFPGVKGAPDRIFGKGGRCIVIEFKRPGGVVSKSQQNRHRELAVWFGWEVHICYSHAQAREVLHLVE